MRDPLAFKSGEEGEEDNLGENERKTPSAVQAADKVVNSTRVIRVNRIKIYDWVEVFDPGQTRVRSQYHTDHVLGQDELGEPALRPQIGAQKYVLF